MATQCGAALADLQVTDVTGQKTANVNNVPRDCTVREFVQELLPRLHLPRNDGGGRPLVYHARLEREGRHLRGNETVGDALQPGDRLTLTPNIEAGGPRPLPTDYRLPTTDYVFRLLSFVF